jgi:hypothetical protein
MSAYEGQAVARWTSPEDRVWTQSGHVLNQISAMQAISRPVGLCYRLGWEGGANPPSERFGTSPVVYDGDLRFMGDNLVVSFARPGGNTTGGTTHADAQSGGEEVKRASWGTYALIV